ncbi:sodium:proton antiporter [Orbaceae bacterium ESL0721]|nr:sodium:proton antiporter [Orbaceae bacterium ESL0721]
MKIGFYAFFTLLPAPLYALDSSDHSLTYLSLLWGVPFVLVLLSIALLPLLLPRLWHHHYGKIMLFWTLLFLAFNLLYFGGGATWQLILHAVLGEFLPFLLLLLALFTVSGGILIQSTMRGTPKNNLCLLALGTLFASIMGTTGAAMLMIRPLIRANQDREYRAHTVIFFIFLVANIGGGLTPIGDPPLFIGFLKGVDFFWTLQHMGLPVAINTLLLLTIFFLIDNFYYRRENNHLKNGESAHQQAASQTLREVKANKIVGGQNMLLLLAIVAVVLLSGIWQSDQAVKVGSVVITLPDLVRNILFIVIILLSLMITPKTIYQMNAFSWEPMIEVGKLFLAIFITITPVLAMLQAGRDGSLAGIIALVTNGAGEPINLCYFWLSGLLSGFLDNAPTYLVFFNLASGDAAILTTKLSSTLLAISMGSVFMGALTYIGNAPNFMIKAIATQNGIQMPSFFGYMRWSILLLIPIFLIDSWIFFM